MAKKVLPGAYAKPSRTMFMCLLMVALSFISRTDASVIFKCDFETSIRPPCSIEEDRINDTFDWNIGSGPTNSRDTGPDVDHTLNNTNGQYFYIEVSGREAGEFATFETPQFNEPGKKCLTMWRNMNGHHIGRLTVYEVTDSDVVIQRAFWEGEETTKAWFENKIEFSDAARRVRITATHGGTTSGQPHGDIAVDDLLLTTGSCSPETSTTSTSTTTTVAPTQVDEQTTAEIEEETTTMAEMTTSFTTEEIAETTSTPEVTTDLQTTTAQDVTSTPTTPGLDTSSEVGTTEGGPTTPVRTTTTTATTEATTVPTSPPTTGISTGATEKATDEENGTPWLIPIVVVFAIGFLFMVVVLSVLVCKRQRKRAVDRRNTNRQNSWDTDKTATKVTSVSETTTDANESSTDNLYHQIYSTPDEIKASKPSDTPPPAVPPSRVLPSPPLRPLPEQPPPTLPRPNHHFEPYHSPHDLEPPRELAPIPPMQNPLAGYDLSPLEDEPPPRDPSPHRHHRRRRHRDEEPERRHRHRDEEPERRHRHKHQPHERPSDGWERDRPAFAMTHDPARANRRTLEAPVNPDYIPLTMGAAPVDATPNGFYRPDPYGPTTPEADWNWTTIPRPRVFY